MKYLLFFLCLVSKAQNSQFFEQYKMKADSNIAKDFHQRQALTIDQLYYKNNPQAALTSFNKSKYLVLEKLRTGKRKRFYTGDVFRFKTKDGRIFEEDLTIIKDSSFLVSSIDLDKNYFAYQEIRLDQVSRIYKRPLRKGLRFGLNSLFVFGAGEPIIDRIQFGIPIDKPKLFSRIIIFGALSLISQNGDKLFRSTKLNENKRLRVFQAY